MVLGSHPSCIVLDASSLSPWSALVLVFQGHTARVEDSRNPPHRGHFEGIAGAKNFASHSSHSMYQRRSSSGTILEVFRAAIGEPLCGGGCHFLQSTQIKHHSDLRAFITFRGESSDTSRGGRSKTRTGIQKRRWRGAVRCNERQVAWSDRCGRHAHSRTDSRWDRIWQRNDCQ